MSSNAWMRRAVAAALSLMCPLSLAACSSKKGSNGIGIRLSCPSPASIASAAGTTFGAPRVARTSVSLGCEYLQGAAGLALSINKSSLNVGQFQSGEEATASASHVNLSPVAGYGSAAYLVTTPGANKATELFILTPSDLVTLGGTLTVVETEAVARFVLTHDLGPTGT